MRQQQGTGFLVHQSCDLCDGHEVQVQVMWLCFEILPPQ
jgi:hypothetical protein